MKKLPFYLFIAAVLVGLCLRIAVCVNLADTPEVSSPNIQTDMATYLRLAGEIRHGQWPDHFDYQPFYYTCLLPLLHLESGSYVLLFIVQILLGTGAVALAGIAAARIYGRRYGWIAALLLALSQFHILYTPFALYEVLQSFWMALLFVLTLNAWRRNHLMHWLWCGLVLALAILTRGNALLYLPVMLVVMYLRNRFCVKRFLVTGVAFCAVVFVPQVPFAVVNSRYTGQLTGASVAGGKVLALGNSPEAPAAGLAYPTTYNKWMEQEDAGKGTATASIIRWALAHPMEFIELKARTFLHFWDAAEIPNNVNIDVHGKPYSAVLRWGGLVGFGLLSTLAWLSMFFPARERSWGRRMLIAFVFTFCVATVMFYMLARFRIAILPLVAVLATGAIPGLLRKVRFWVGSSPAERRRSACLSGVLILLAILIPNFILNAYQYLYEADVHAALTPNGTAVMFEDGSAILHDHGPLPMGEGGICAIAADKNDAALKVRKTFVVPQEMREALRNRGFVVRVMLPNRVTAELSAEGSSIACGEQSVVPTCVNRYAFSFWLEAEFTHFSPAPDGTVSVLFTLPKNSTVCADRLRFYRRTALIHSEASERTLPAEVFAEIEVKKAE